MLALLVQKLAAQGGLVTRAQAFDAGLTPSRLTALVRAGDLVLVRRGVYADGELWRSLDEYVGRPLLRVRAAVMVLDRAWVASHDSSALVHGMPVLGAAESLVHVTRPGYSSAWTRAGVSHHYARFAPGEVLTSDDGMRYLCVARTAVDMARYHGELAGLVACDWALRQGVTRSELLETCLAMIFWPGIVATRAAIGRADPRAESVAETLGRDLVEELGVGPVDPQVPIALQGRPHWCDLRVGNHVFEVQGEIKYRSQDQGGVAERPISEVVVAEKKRSRLVRAEDLGLSEILWEDFWGAGRRAALARLKMEYVATERRFGPELHPRLAAQAAAMRERHGWRAGRADPGMLLTVATSGMRSEPQPRSPNGQ